MKLYWRIPWLVALAFGFGLTMTIIVNLTALRRETEIFTTTVTEATLTQTVLVAQAIDREAKQRDWVQVQARLRRLNRQPLQAYYQVIAPDGRILADSRRIEPSGRLDSALSMQMLTGATLISADPELPHHIQVTILLPDQTGQSAAILRNVTNWESQFTAKQGQARISMVIALLTTIAITAGMLTLFWRLVVGPLETLRQLAEAVTQGEVAARAPSFHVVELQQVGAALNQMLARSATQQYELERVNRWLQTTNAALQAQTETVQTINYIGRLLSAETAQQKLTQSVIDATTELTGAEFGAFFYNVRNERGETHQHYTIAGASPAAIVSSPMSSNTALLAHTFQGREVIRLADVRQSPQYGHHAPYYGIPPGHVPVVSYLAAPIISRSDQIIGGLFFGHSQAGIFTERAEQIVVGLVAQIAIAMDNAHLFAAAQSEITERKQAEAQFKASLTEKEALLKEIHHRVKNNLQVISSLLNLQSRQVTEQPMLEIFKESQHRIRSMAIIHEKLYQAPNLAQINFADYVYSLAGYLFRSYGINTTAISLKVNIIDIALTLETAIPCGLIINELVSNSLKYAFSPDQTGEISITLGPVMANFQTGAQQLCLTVSDNGSGLPLAVDFHHTHSFGLQLVNLLTEQLDGVVEVDRSNGTAIKITFCLPTLYGAMP